MQQFPAACVVSIGISHLFCIWQSTVGYNKNCKLGFWAQKKRGFLPAILLTKWLLFAFLGELIGQPCNLTLHLLDLRG